MTDSGADPSRQRFFATCPKGIESLLMAELTELGMHGLKETVAGVGFDATVPEAMRVCLWSRLASRVRRVLIESTVASPEDLYQQVQSLSWDAHFSVDATFSVHATVNANEQFRDSRFAALTVKDAIVDQYRDRYDRRPDVERKHPDIQCYVHIHRQTLVVGLDLMPRGLHQRGYRSEAVRAPLRENLAAAMLLRAGWPEMAHQGASLVDPMCGSATLLIEAAMMAADIAPGLLQARRTTSAWLEWDEAAWEALVAEALDRKSVGLQQMSCILIGVDQDAETLSVARTSIDYAGLHRYVEVHQGDYREAGLFAPEQPGLLITNPPYGERLSELSRLHDLYLNIGKAMQQGFAGWQFTLIVADPHLCRLFPFAVRQQYTLYNGPLLCKLMTFEIPESERGLSEHAMMLVNRLNKNQRKLKKYRAQHQIEAYRLYDADLPEYSAAVDCYGSRIHIQEYQAPQDIPESVTRQRLADLVRAVDHVLEPEAGAMVVKQRARQRGSSQYEKQLDDERGFWVQEQGLKYLVKLESYLDTGLFLDHRDTRRWIREAAAGGKFLNLFCYTGSVTVAAAAGGATASVSVDLSKTYLAWARTNLAANDIEQKAHRLEHADCMRWIRDTDEVFDLMFIDPPTFSNSKRMDDVFDVQRDHPKLLGYAVARLAAGGRIVFSTNARKFKPQMDDLLGVRYRETTQQTVPPDFRQRPSHRSWLFERIDD